MPGIDRKKIPLSLPRTRSRASHLVAGVLTSVCTVGSAAVALPAAVATAQPAAVPVAATTSTTTSTEITSTLVTTGSSCRFLNGAAAPDGWQAPGFADGAWKSGPSPLGHQDPVATDIGLPAKTAYFRCGFTVDDVTPTKATVSARVDDGAVLYVNGTEVARTNMPSGAVGFTTSASTVDNWDGTRWLSWDVDPGLLKPGTNVLAVSVHQNFTSSWISGDAMMDAKLTMTAKPNPKPEWNLVFADEFDGTAVNTANWKAYHNTYGDGDAHMLQCNTPDNVVVSGGTVKLTAKKQRVNCPWNKVRDYTSGFLGSRDVGRYHPLYGRYEMRARTPHGQGLFPALWLRHRNGASAAEVDIFEAFHSQAPGRATATLHFPTSIGYNVAKKTTWIETPTTSRGGWHTYSVDILPVTPGDNTKVKFRFAIDGVTTLEYTNPNASKWTSVDPNGGWDIALQLYVGGQWTGHPDQKLGWLPVNGGVCARTLKAPLGGDPKNCPTDGIQLAQWNDATFEIDYVRVYTKN